MKTLPTKLIILVAACTLAGCSTVMVTTNYDHSVAFGKYKTYTIAPPAGGQKLSPASEAALRSAIRTQLAARGVTEAKTGKGDLAIVPQVFTQQHISVQQYTDWGYGAGGWPYRYGAYRMWPGVPGNYTNVSTYTEGTLLLDVVDTRTNKLVFRGTGTAVLGGPESNALKIKEAVAKMLAALPTKH